MKKIIISAIAIAAVAAVAISVQANRSLAEEDVQVAEWESLALQGDTAAMHRLIEFYNEHAVEYVEVAEVIDCDGNEVPQEEIDQMNEEGRRNAERSEEYAERLNHWLDKGLAMGDPVALETKGMRLYYTDEQQAVKYLSKAAKAGSGRAALFCGSACLNQQRGDEAFRYLTMAYEAGVPSAGWHLAMCYSAGLGTEPDRDKAVEVMRHAALLNYPEAVSEMRRIEPDNRMWHHKADSLGISFPDFIIVPDQD